MHALHTFQYTTQNYVQCDTTHNTYQFAFLMQCTNIVTSPYKLAANKHTGDCPSTSEPFQIVLNGVHLWVLVNLCEVVFVIDCVDNIYRATCDNQVVSHTSMTCKASGWTSSPNKSRALREYPQ